MKIEGRERVPLPPAETWLRLNDPAVIQRCTPGLEELYESAPEHFDAVLEIALPALTGRFTGSIDFLERRAPDLLRMRLAGKGPAGFVAGEATLELAPAPADAGTEVRYQADVQVGGQIARLGQRLLSGMAKEMAGQFFEAFASEAAELETRSARARPLVAFLQLLWRTLRNLLGLSSRS